VRVGTDRLAAVFITEMRANTNNVWAAVRVVCLQMTLTAACWKSSGEAQQHTPVMISTAAVSREQAACSAAAAAARLTTSTQRKMLFKPARSSGPPARLA
jgi:hypothetical protein